MGIIIFPPLQLQRRALSPGDTGFQQSPGRASGKSISGVCDALPWPGTCSPHCDVAPKPHELSRMPPVWTVVLRPQ